MRRWLPATFIAGAWIFSLAVYSRLPDRIAVHWGISGNPDRYGSRIEGAFLMPVVMIVLYAIMQWYPSRDPRAQNIAKFRGAYDTIVAASVALLGSVHVLALGNALGWRVDMSTIAFVAVGALFMLLGNLLPLARSNFIFGVRTPWTLSSEAVWSRSQRVGGYALVAAGLLTIVSAFFARPVGVTIALSSLILAAAIPVVYSYVLWSRDRRGPTNGQS
jgi:immunity protein, SdpI family